jgi:Tfp pilus assembly protein FimT
MTALAAPVTTSFMRNVKARTAAQQVERTLQTARLKAVTTSRALRVRLDCPAAGQLRILEVTGVGATDTASNRCDPAAYPSPGPQDALRSTPAHDSPVVYLPTGATVTGAPTILEFDPRGAVYAVAAGGAVTQLAGEVVWTVTRSGQSNTVSTNALGRVRLN